MEQRDTFDAVADLYAEARPGYPAALYEEMWALARLEADARVLEVGCGAGQATGDLAARASSVTAVDPGARLIERARRRASATNVTYQVARFEDFAANPGSFDLVASAQAWHWVDPAVGFAKAAQALRPRGALAIFGHVPGPLPEPAHSAFGRVVERHLPGAWGSPPSQAAYGPEGPFEAQFARSGLFGPVTHRAYAWTWRLDPQMLGRYLRTDSSYHGLPEAQRFAMFDDLSAAVAELGGVLEAPFETHLHIAERL